MKKPRLTSKEATIEELAMKHVYSSVNNFHYQMVMEKRWGRAAAKAAIENARNVQKIVDPDFVRPNDKYTIRRQCRTRHERTPWSYASPKP